jgi:hypothetical protein
MIFQTCKDFCMMLQCELQVDAIHRIPKMHRFLQFDVSGSIVKITKHMNSHYGPVSINYFFET